MRTMITKTKWGSLPDFPWGRTCLLAWVAATSTGATFPRGVGPPAAADTLTIAQCVRLARNEAPSVRAAMLEKQAAANGATALRFNGRPEFSLTGDALGAPRGYYDPVITNLGDYELKANVLWTLADGGRRSHARTRASLDSTLARWQEDLIARDTGLRAAFLATNLLQLQESDSVLVSAADWLDRLNQLVQAGVTSGVRSPSDSVRVSIERDGVVAALERAQLDRQSMAMELGLLLGRGVDASLWIVPAEGSSETIPQEADSLALLASAQHQPEVDIARTAEAQTRIDWLDARSSSAPTIEVGLDAGLVGADLTSPIPEALRSTHPGATFGDRLRQDLGASAAIHVKFPVAGPAVRYQVRSREAAQDAARVRADAESAAQHAAAIMLYSQWRSAHRRLQAARVTSARAEDHLLRIKSLYSVGATTLLDLLDARRTYEDARQRMAEARMDVRLAQFQVEDRK